MSLYPKPHDSAQKIQSDISTFKGHLLSVSMFGLGEPAVKDNDSIMAIVALQEATTQTITTFDAQPDVPRTVTVKGGQAGMNKKVKVTGLNVLGQEISEEITCNGAGAIAGTKAFYTITKVELPVWNTDAVDTVSVGFGAKLALPYKLGYNTVFSAYLNGVREATAPTITVDAVAIEKNTIELNSAFNGSLVEVILGI